MWSLAVGRFPEPLRRRIGRDVALREIARGFLSQAGLTVRGELARVTGLSRSDAGRGNRALVAEGYAVMEGVGIYRKADLKVRLYDDHDMQPHRSTRRRHVSPALSDGSDERAVAHSRRQR